MARYIPPKRFLKRDLSLYFARQLFGLSYYTLAKLYNMNMGRVHQVVTRERAELDGY